MNNCQINFNYNETDEGIVWMRRNNNDSNNPTTAKTNKFGCKTIEIAEQLEQLTIAPVYPMENEKIETVLGNDATSTDGNDSDQEPDNEEIVLNDEDVWDDSLLIKMYESSQAQINNALIERFSNQTNQDTTNGNKNNNTNNTGNNNKKQSSSKSKTNTSNNSTTKKQPSLSKSAYNWKVNDFCRVIYTEDSIEYEAKIISINSQDQNCLVRYIGYENEEVCNLSDLNPSAGEYVRKMQVNMAIQDGYGQSEEKAASENLRKPEIKQAQQPATSIHLVPESSQQPINMQSSRIIPPPPPFAESIVNPTISIGPTKDSEDDVLASMLMSWYMTGYHTGYYQARKDLQQSNNSTCRCCNKQ